MPTPIISISGFLCERVLREADGVHSAIRIVDVFYVPDVPGGMMEFRALVSIKAQPGDDSEHLVDWKLENPDGTERLLDGTAKTVTFGSLLGPKVPGGANLVVHFNIPAEVLGTHFLHVLLDGEVVLTLPLTLLHPQIEETH